MAAGNDPGGRGAGPVRDCLAGRLIPGRAGSLVGRGRIGDGRSDGSDHGRAGDLGQPAAVLPGRGGQGDQVAALGVAYRRVNRVVSGRGSGVLRGHLAVRRGQRLDWVRIRTVRVAGPAGGDGGLVLRVAGRRGARGGRFGVLGLPGLRRGRAWPGWRAWAAWCRGRAGAAGLRRGTGSRGSRGSEGSRGRTGSGGSRGAGWSAWASWVAGTFGGTWSAWPDGVAGSSGSTWPDGLAWSDGAGGTTWSRWWDSARGPGGYGRGLPFDCTAPACLSGCVGVCGPDTDPGPGGL